MTEVQNNTTLPPLPDAGTSGGLTPPPSVPSPTEDPKVPPPAEKAIAELSSQFLTGMACLEPVSEACLSRLFKLWQGPEKPTESNLEPFQWNPFHWLLPESEQDSGISGEHLLREGISQYLAEEIQKQAEKAGEFFLKGLEHQMKGEQLYTPAQPEAPSCEVKKDDVGNLRKECTIPGEFK